MLLCTIQAVGKNRAIINRMNNQNAQENLPEPDGSRRPHPVRSGSITVLHVDDDPNDILLLQAATRKASLEFILHNVEDGEQAIAYLSGEGIYADRKRFQIPALILLDLKMPRLTGFEILKWVRARPGLGKLPVVVLSGSELKEDILRAYSTGANSYLVKPLGFDALVGLVKNLHSAWLAPLQSRSPS